MSSSHIVIIGGSSGIGLAAARRLLSNGYKVTITGRDSARLANAKASLDDVTAVRMDAADTGSLPSAFASIGKFDHLVLAFGSGKGAGPFGTVNINEVRQGFEEKVFPHFACAQAALPHLADGGSITFIAAVTAHAAMPGTAGIGAANAAVAALVPILASELRPIRVNGVSPGVIDTPWWDFLSDEQKQPVFADFASKTATGRVGTADDVGRAIAFLIEDSFMTGQTIICDGGLRLGA